ncbi:MAG TPA: MFS transporter [Candidatus Thalassarchaeaceae archaeon]|nr:MFS transporter [Candidatus Thalassarchaeaceae archaeon]
MTGVGYLELLKTNRSFRRLFVANEISFIGDWFTVIALFMLAGEASDNSPLAIAGVLASRSFSLALVTPFTGMLADRYSRKGLMFGANIASLVVLVIVLVFNLLESLTSVYILAVVMVAARAVFDPAEYAYLPNICNEEELLTANALASGGWSVALGIGSAIGGLTISQFGINTALWIDTVTFVVAAFTIMTLPTGGPDVSERKSATPKLIVGEIVSGWKYILSLPSLRRVIFAKGLWASGGGAQVFLLVLIGMEVGFGEVAAGVGILFMVRGFGSGFGPLAGRSLMSNPRLIPYLLGIAVGVCGTFYIAVAYFVGQENPADWKEIILILVFFSHAASGLNWVLSTTLLQKRSDDEWRGRVAGTDHFVITVMMGISALSAGLIMENELLDLVEVIALTGLVQIMLGLAWIMLASPSEKKIIQQALVES